MFSSARSLLRPTTALLSRRYISRTAAMYDDLPYHLVVGLPALSPTMDQGTLSEWYVKEGDSFSAGDAIAKIETDKAAMDFEAQDDGVVAKILIPAGEGEDLDVGTPIMVTVEDAADVAAFSNFSAPNAPKAAATEAPKAVEPPKPAAAPAAPVKTEPAPTPKAQPPPKVVEAPAAVQAVDPPVSAVAASSPLAKRMAKQQQAYLERFGTTGYKPIQIDEAA